MVITIPETIQNVYMVGDCHGNWNLVIYHIRHYKISNSVFIFCGDIGIGFESLKHYTDHVIPELHKVLKKFNNRFIWFAGNHDNPKFFEEQLINTEYVKCVPNYAIINVCNKNILCVSGGISVDRTYRKQTDSVRIVDYMKYHACDYQTAVQNLPMSYWEDEQVKYQPKVEEQIDIICSHSAPSFCEPSFKGDFVLSWAEHDKTLLADLDVERQTLDKVYNDYKDTITHWYYGHFHKSNVEFIDNCKFTLLGIGEIKLHDNYQE